MSSRIIATQIISQVFENKLTLTHALQNNESFKQSGNDKALIQEICYGTFRWYVQLEYILNHLLEKRIKKKDSQLKYLMIIGLYQLRFMRIPAHAVVSETVNTCKKIKMEWAKNLVNAILRRYLRDTKIFDPNVNNGYSFNTSHPKWIIKQLRLDWPEEWESILEANNQHPPMYLRVNQLHQSRQEYLIKMEKAGILGKITPYSKQGILVEKPVDVGLLPGFSEGDVSVQELAAQFSVKLLDLKPRQTVLDACAAPGGKSSHILESQPNLESLTVIEKDFGRAKRLSETFMRLGLNATIKVSDINDLENWWRNELYDRILLDAPCSATGVIRRHPDIKTLRTYAEVKVISALQMQLIETLWKTLKLNGLLVYVTCSIFKQENSELIKQFIGKNENCVLKNIDAEWGENTGYGKQILTGQSNMDGFFYSCLKKI
ncbi:MAG: 16S rRNA (cytosine(967)-C(5))-methyltransferase [Legionellales bacterium]|nr:16S rRNA (cytosine(967)-C(5))-methyltransferase [Legionellales bacterium]